MSGLVSTKHDQEWVIMDSLNSKPIQCWVLGFLVFPRGNSPRDLTTFQNAFWMCSIFTYGPFRLRVQFPEFAALINPGKILMASWVTILRSFGKRRVATQLQRPENITWRAQAYRNSLPGFEPNLLQKVILGGSSSSYRRAKGKSPALRTKSTFSDVSLILLSLQALVVHSVFSLVKASNEHFRGQTQLILTTCINVSCGNKT